MDDNSTILTVAYGGFSYTLEAFDDRYFGAEPRKTTGCRTFWPMP